MFKTSTISIFSFEFKKVGDRYGFGIQGEWDSEYMAGANCSFYSTINGVDVRFFIVEF